MNSKYPFAEIVLPDRPIYIKKTFERKNVLVEPHTHRLLEIGIVIKGASVHSCMGQTHVIIPGDFYVIHPGVEHHFQPNILTYWYDVLILTENNIPEINEMLENEHIQNMLYPKKSHVAYPLYHINTKEREDIIDVLNKTIKEQNDRSDNHLLMIKAYFYILLTKLARVVKANDNASFIDRSVIARPLEHIDSNFNHDIKVSYLAQIANISESHLRRVFQEQIGMSPIKYINMVRIQKAAMLLENDGCSVAEAAERVGIYDLAYFSKLFKQTIGISPSGIKKSIRL